MTAKLVFVIYAAFVCLITAIYFSKHLNPSLIFLEKYKEMKSGSSLFAHLFFFTKSKINMFALSVSSHIHSKFKLRWFE